MGTLLASNLIARASELAQDETNEVWTSSQALEWVNDAQRSVCLVRPDASSINHSIQLVPGTKQSVDGRRLMSVFRNTGIDGVTIGRAIRLIDKNVKDESDPDWHTEVASTVIDEYIYDARTPQVFYVSPPVHASTAVYVEISEATNPADIADSGDPIDINDIYAPAMIEWICYRFFGRDSENTPNHARGMYYFKSFFNLLGEKMRIDMAITPKLETAGVTRDAQ